MTAVRTHWLTGLIVLVIAVLGLPEVWQALRDGDAGVETVFFPVLGAAFLYLAVAKR
ncbi:MAG: hypothetical protein JWN08_3607 [Frankiales bacterium]|nr:hypothetical protein [Frankiales bacterium]MCW2777448.1 hypothetical protein [Frankiales bacterium]